VEYTEILKRAWHLVRNYRALWVFGIILALVTGGGAGGGQYTLRGEDFSPGGQFHLDEIAPGAVSTLISIGVGLACAVVVLIIAAAVARYVAETALIRMVDDHEETGQRHNVRQGFRIGWSRTALRLFLIDLLTSLPVALAFLLLFALAAAPLLMWTTRSPVAGAVGTVATVGLGLLVILLVIATSVILSALMRFFRRVCVLERLGVTDSIRRGYFMVRQHLKHVAIMWLITLGLGIGWAILMILITLLLVVIGAVLGGVPALVVGTLASLAYGDVVPWILAAVVGLPIFILVLAVPLAFLNGLWEAFNSSVWTMVYRQLLALESVEVAQANPDDSQAHAPAETDL
jgi:hypothetical protein